MDGYDLSDSLTDLAWSADPPYVTDKNDRPGRKQAEYDGPVDSSRVIYRGRTI